MTSADDYRRRNKLDEQNFQRLYTGVQVWLEKFKQMNGYWENWPESSTNSPKTFRFEKIKMVSLPTVNVVENTDADFQRSKA